MSLLSKLKKVFSITDYMEYPINGTPFVAVAESYDKWGCFDFEEDLHQEILAISKDERTEYLKRFKDELQEVLESYDRQKESVRRLNNQEYISCLIQYEENLIIDEDEFSLDEDLIYTNDYTNYQLKLHEDSVGMEQLFYILDCYKMRILKQFDTNPDFKILKEEAPRATAPKFKDPLFTLKGSPDEAKAKIIYSRVAGTYIDCSKQTFLHFFFNSAIQPTEECIKWAYKKSTNFYPLLFLSVLTTEDYRQAKGATKNRWRNVNTLFGEKFRRDVDMTTQPFSDKKKYKDALELLIK